VRGHRFYDVGDSEDLRLDEDVLFREPLWIAGTVESLVMLEDDLRHRPRERDHRPVLLLAFEQGRCLLRDFLFEMFAVADVLRLQPRPFVGERLDARGAGVKDSRRS